MMRSVSTIWGVEMTEQMVVETAEETKSNAGPAERRGNQEESVALVACVNVVCLLVLCCVWGLREGFAGGVHSWLVLGCLCVCVGGGGGDRPTPW
jgi:hypothetical protein